MKTRRDPARPRGTRSECASFTLIEMLAVMAIIAIIAGIIIAGSSQAQRQSDIKRARAGLEKLKLAIEEYRAQRGQVPSSSFNGAMDNTAWQMLTNYARGLVFPDDFRDSWGRAYLYTNRTRFSYLIMSKGPDTNAPHDDITNEQAGD